MIKENFDYNKKRILHVLYDLYVGGAEMLLLHLIKGLGFEDYEHYVYYFGSDGPMREKINALGVPVYKGKMVASINHPVTFLATLSSLIKDLSKVIKNRRIHVIQSHLRRANQLSVAVGKISGIPCFPTVHNTMAFVDPRNRWEFRVLLNKLVDRFAYRNADKIIAVSPEIKGIINKKFDLDDSKVVVVKNGIFFDERSIENVDLERELPESKNKLIILAVGRLTYQKNFEVLIKSAKNLLAKGFKDFIVLIVGEGEERSRLERLISDLEIMENVKLLGLRHDVMGLMKSCNLFIMPSRYEGLSIAMIEAMACELPIIATDSPGLSDYINDGENGVVFPVGNDHKLSEKIIYLAKNDKLRKILSTGALKTFKNEYDFRKNILSLDKLIRQYSTRI